ncbi:hypothetical protein T11_14803 [Trichinella zimbabwensis]|uniref:Uncharacterized protein n=1 Tax=Trichinella zimbabwensis TaxID=268475 RepID=A0A0V1I0T7_9BILA|nr:hypothetical protein T11_14803 [Trichinella zimbabwensis]
MHSKKLHHIIFRLDHLKKSSGRIFISKRFSCIYLTKLTVEQQSNKWCGKIASKQHAIYFSQLQEKLKAKIDFTKECSKERQFIDIFAFEQMKVIFIK